MPEKPKIPVGPPHGGENGDGFCCGHRTIDVKRVEENRGQHKSATRWFVTGTWQCYIMDHHNGMLAFTPIKED